MKLRVELVVGEIRKIVELEEEDSWMLVEPTLRKILGALREDETRAESPPHSRWPSPRSRELE